MAGVNKVILVGHLGKDPEIRHSQNSDKIATFSMATSETWKDRQSGERKEKTEWHRVVIFNPNLAEIAEKYLRKGAKAYIEGQLQTRKYTDGQGVERFVTEVVIGRFKGELVLLDRQPSTAPPPADSPDAYGSQRSYTGYGTPPAAAASGTAPPPDFDDQIPF